MHYLVVSKDKSDRIHADLTLMEWASYGAKYPAERFDVYTTEEDVFAPGPVPVTKTLIDRGAPSIEDRLAAVETEVNGA